MQLEARPVPADWHGAGEVASWGRLLLAIGLLLTIVGTLVSTLWSIWGVLFLGLGGLSQKIRRPAMLLICGIVLMWAGLSRLVGPAGEWRIAGFGLLVLGLALLWRFRGHWRRLGASAQTGPGVGGMHLADLPLLPTFPLVSYSLGLIALIALPLVFVVALGHGGRNGGQLLPFLLTGDTAVAALGLAFGSAAIPEAIKHRSLAVWGVVACSVVLMAFLALAAVALFVEAS